MRVSIICLVLAACGSPAAEPEQQASSGEEAPAPASLLAVGTAAPDFSVPDQTGTAHTLAAERGHIVVLYFYPRDATPGCTAEACAFRDAWNRYSEAGVTIFGVSTDDVESHRAFADEHELPFPLLADTDAHVADLYGVAHDHNAADRVTFIIDATGTIARVFPDVDPGVHADEVLSAIAEL